MSNRKETAGKTATECDEGRTITVTISGERYDLLERIANAMNSVSWCSSDNTPESVLAGFALPYTASLLDSPRELCDTILDGIGTSDDWTGDAPEPIRSARLDELRRAFAELRDL